MKKRKLFKKDKSAYKIELFAGDTFEYCPMYGGNCNCPTYSGTNCVTTCNKK